VLNYISQSDWQSEVFGVDFETVEVVFCGGARVEVEAWRDPIGLECLPSMARAAMFRGPSGLPFIIDIYAYHIPEALH